MRKYQFIVTLLCFALLFGALSTTAWAAQEDNDIGKLIAQLPKVEDPLGTEFYFYNQLTDTEKVLYWEFSKASWENPTVTICGLQGFTQETIDYAAQRALAALVADDPEYHLLWERWVSGELEGDFYCATLDKIDVVTDYHYQKAMARAKQIAAIIGMEGDTYTRLRELMDLLCEDTDYNDDLLARYGSIITYDDSAYGCLLHGLSVCGGYSDTVKLLCDRLQIPCITVQSSKEPLHAWNYVRMDDGQWYAVDGTVDEIASPIMGNAGWYASTPAYSGSANCLYTGTFALVDFRFPTMEKEDYPHREDFKPEYHNAKLDFVEPEAQFLYQPNDDGITCTVTGYIGEQTGDLVIPEKIDGYIVTEIGDSAFARCTGFTGDLVIPDTVTVIQMSAFYQSTGFSGTLHLSENLQSIWNTAFLGCEGLSGSLVIPENVDFLGFGAFLRCKGFTGDLRIPAVSHMENNVFDYCSGFDGTLYLSDGLIWDDTIVGDTNFQNVYVDQTNPLYAVQDGILYSKDFKTLVWCPTGKTGDVIVPDGVEVIGANAFETCRGVNTLTLPDGLKTIEEYAFFNSGFVGELVLPGTLESIGPVAFVNTKFSGDLVVPNSVSYIGENAFGGIQMGGTLTLSNSLEVIESGAFSDAKFTGDLVIPDSVKRIKREAFCACHFDGKLVIPETVEYIEEMAFAGRDFYEDRVVFTNALDLSQSGIKLEPNVFEYTVFPDFQCNCEMEYAFEMVSEPTCMQSGWSREVCPNCGGSNWKQEDILDHQYEVTVIEPTCTNNGYTYYVCAVCRDSYETDYVPAFGHRYEPTVIEPSCTTEGYTIYNCVGCEENYIADCIPARHQCTSTVIEPSCFTDGYTHHVCDICGTSYDTDYIPARHQYEITVIEPDCTNDGYSYYVCVACGEAYTADHVPAVGHRYDSQGEATVVEPSCETEGYTIYSCEVCGDSYTADYVPLLGHQYENGQCIYCGAGKEEVQGGGQIVVYDGRCYQVFTGNLSWTEAQKACEAMGGHLVTITSSREQEVVSKLTGERLLWIGAMLDASGLWSWVNGEAWTYSNWCEGEPSGGGENRGLLDYGGWNDVVDRYLHTEGFICEWDDLSKLPDGFSLPSDLNGDGKLNNKDAARLFQYMTGWNVEVNEALLDINGDGKVNNKDATRLFQYLSGWDVEIY